MAGSAAIAEIPLEPFKARACLFDHKTSNQKDPREAVIGSL